MSYFKYSTKASTSTFIDIEINYCIQKRTVTEEKKYKALQIERDLKIKSSLPM